MFAAGCKKKVVTAAAPPPPPPPAPVVTPPPPRPAAVGQFTVEPASIERGQAATVRWSVTDATAVTIEPGLGTVQSNGNRQVFPSNTTTYRLTATGAGGNASATATVNVTVPPPPPPPPPPDRKNLTTRLETEVGDAFFDYDSSDIREDARSALARNSDSLKAILRDFPSASVVVEGHCDERGSAEYNLGLGDRRATAAKEYMTQLGIAADRMKTISYGKERPQCTDPSEACYQKNRRAHFGPGQ
jgi:peptidoglycan-associated lipoprotein